MRKSTTRAKDKKEEHCLHIIKDIDVSNSFFENNVAVSNNIYFKNSTISKGSLYVNENCSNNSCDLDKDTQKFCEYSYFDKKNYEYSLESLRLAELHNNGVGEVKNTTLYLKGTNECENVFNFKYNDIYNSKHSLETILKIKITVPKNSQIIINIIGMKVIFNSIDIYINNQKMTTENNSCKIIWNFPETSLFKSNFSLLYGSFFLPFANVFFKNVTLYGFLVARTLKGDCKVFFRKYLQTPIVSTRGNIDSSPSCYTTYCTTTCVPTTYCTTTCIPTTTCTTYDCSNKFEQAYVDVIESIALEEVGLAHIINAEGEKIQKALDLAENTDDLLKINNSVKRTLATVNHSQMLLQYKLEEVKKQLNRC